MDRTTTTIMETVVEWDSGNSSRENAKTRQPGMGGNWLRPLTGGGVILLATLSDTHFRYQETDWKKYWW